MINLGSLITHSGRIQNYSERERSVSVIFRNRVSSSVEELSVSKVINCTGPDCDVRTINDPLMKHLRERGYIRPDQLGLGLDVGEDGALINSLGKTSLNLYTVGALRKGNLWETTAVPEIRDQCTSLARVLAGSPQRDVRPILVA